MSRRSPTCRRPSSALTGRRTGWLVLAWLVLGLLAPGLSRALQAATAAPWQQVCVGAAAVGAARWAAAAPGAEGSTAAMPGDCPLCGGPHDCPGQPPRQLNTQPWPADMPAPAVPAALPVRGDAPWARPPSRAPPSGPHP